MIDYCSCLVTLVYYVLLYLLLHILWWTRAVNLFGTWSQNVADMKIFVLNPTQTHFHKLATSIMMNTCCYVVWWSQNVADLKIFSRIPRWTSFSQFSYPYYDETHTVLLFLLESFFKVQNAALVHDRLICILLQTNTSYFALRYLQVDRPTIIQALSL